MSGARRSEDFFIIGDYEMLLDEEMTDAYARLKTPHYVLRWNPNYQMIPMDNTIWPQGKIRMKRILRSLTPGHPNEHAIAAMYFAMAVRRTFAHGVPRMLIKVSMTAECLTRAFLENTVENFRGQHTLAFCKPLTKEYYGVGFDSAQHEIPPERGQQLLELGQRVLNHNLSIIGLNIYPPGADDVTDDDRQTRARTA